MTKSLTGKFAEAHTLMGAIIEEIEGRRGVERVDRVVALAPTWGDVAVLIRAGFDELQHKINTSADIAELARIARDQSPLRLVLEYQLRSERYLGVLLLSNPKPAATQGELQLSATARRRKQTNGNDMATTRSN